ncbi:M1 aminopeptidase family protein [Tsukamurella soli]|uniref:CHAD domain-containing protein n=1 Tax=Tsukamurella soli TaxID=644556 RepID=A0ABP8KJE6_9ACTN
MTSRLQELGQALDRVLADGDQIAESLVAMDSHPGIRLLSGVAPTGLTARRWPEAAAAMSAAWQYHGRFREVVEQARELRRRADRPRRRPADADLVELPELLYGPVTGGLGDRPGKDGPLTLADLIARIAVGRDTALGVLTAVQNAWVETMPPLDTVDRRLAEAAVLAESVGTGRNRVVALRRELERAREAVITDPLSARIADPVPALAGRLDALTAELACHAAVRDGFDARLAALDAVLRDVEATEATAPQSYSSVLDTIAAPGLPVPDDRGSAGLRSRIDRLRALRDTASRGALAAEPAAVDRLAGDTHSAALQTLRSVTGQLDRRAELRGRLSAYQAKAAYFGLAEAVAARTAGLYGQGGRQ